VRLRVVAGRFGGRFIEAPRGRTTRPTPERVREAWFSALGEDVLGATVLDLFAGSGAMGIEALSRGARHVHFVEADRRALETLRRNLDVLGVRDLATVVRNDVFRWLAAQEGKWDLALADPPYAGGGAARLARVFRDVPFADRLWVEHASSDVEFGMEPAWSRRYGDSRVSRFNAVEDARED